MENKTGNVSNESQEMQVLDELRRAEGGWVNGRRFGREMFISQYHRAIFNLQRRREKYRYEGEVESSEFTDQFGFKSYRIKKSPRQPRLMPLSQKFN